MNVCLYKTISLSSKDIDDDAAYVIAFGLRNNTTVEKLDLSHNNITANGMKKLSKYIKHCTSINYVFGMKEWSKCKHCTSLNYIDLSENNSSPWGVYCSIIKNCCVNSLTLCGDTGIKLAICQGINELSTNQ